MIGNNQIEELLNQIRSGRGRVNLHDLEFETTDTTRIPLSMHATIESRDQKLSLRVQRRQGDSFPSGIGEVFDRNQGQPVTITQQDFVSARAKTDEGLSIRLEGIVPSLPESRHTHYSDSFNLRFGRISILPERLDSLTYSQIGQVLDALNETVSPDSEAAVAAVEVVHPEHVFFAILPNTELKIANTGTENIINHPFRGELISSKRNCFRDNLLGGEFCLEAEGNDLLVYYRKQHNDSGPTPSRIFDSILDAVGLTHCCHPFPIYQEERVSGQLVESWCQPRDDLNSDCLGPMSSERLDRQGDGQQLFTRAAEFFASDTDLAQTCSRALWLMREACRGNTAHEIRILSLCSILEGLLAPNSGETWRDGAPRLRGEVEWQTAVGNLSLNWNDCFLAIWNSFREFRNNMAHGFRVTSQTGDSNQIFNAYSRISGGIYITLAQLMSFQGAMEKSLLEGTETITLATQ